MTVEGCEALDTLRRSVDVPQQPRIRKRCGEQAPTVTLLAAYQELAQDPLKPDTRPVIDNYREILQICRRIMPQRSNAQLIVRIAADAGMWGEVMRG